MTDNLRIQHQPLTPFRPGKPAGAAQEKDAAVFGKLLQEARQTGSGLRISAHAAERLRQRNINLGEAELAVIGEAVDRARRKGVNSSLLLLGDMALIASVKNNTIITAVDAGEMKERVFTGIDGAVVIR